MTSLSSLQTAIARHRRLPSLLAALGVVVAGATATLSAQSPPPVHGPIALEGTMKQVYAAAHTVIVATIDGVEHVYHFTTDLVVYGGKGPGVDALKGLDEGIPVVVHYIVTGTQASVQEIDRVGDEGLKITEGVVAHIDRRRRQITIRFDNGKTETLRLTQRAAAEAQDVGPAGEGATRVVVYYSDEAGGQKIAHYFKKTS